MKTAKLAPWMIRSSVLAMGVAIVAIGVTSPGQSQSFLGSHIVRAGQVDNFDESTPGVTTISINGAAPQTVIDWTPSNAPDANGQISFQAAGTTVTFERGGSDFAILNRIIPTDTSNSVRLDGTILGRVGSGLSQSGGTVFFYSPGGLIVGATARIDVGALGLSTVSPSYTGGAFTGQFIATDGAGNKTVRYGIDSGFNPATAGSKVVIEAPAVPTAQQITALVDKYSYVSVFAPYIEQAGKIDVNGSTALVAGSAGTLTWNTSGLYNVQVSIGTDGDAGVGINHTGSTGGSVGSGVNDGTDHHRVYLVSIPRNTAVTTLIQGGSSLGFDVATAADVSGNAVILSAGYDVNGDSPTGTSATGTGASDVVITNAAFTSRLDSYATRDLGFLAQGGGLSFASDLTAAAGRDIAIEALGGGTVNAASRIALTGVREARVEANGVGSSITTGSDIALFSTILGDGSAQSITGGQSLLYSLNGGSITVQGGVLLDASARFSPGAMMGVAGNATGGVARIDAGDGGLIDIVGDVTVQANGLGSQDGPNGLGRGGLAQVLISGGNAGVSVGGDLLIAARGNDEPFSSIVSGFAGNDGEGGNAQISMSTGLGNSLTVSGTALVSASGIGLDSLDAASGGGTGGQAEVTIGDGSTASFSSLTVEAQGQSGIVGGSVGGAAGSATGGLATITLTDATSQATFSQDLTVDGSAYYVGSSSGVLTATGAVQGGTAAVSAGGGSLTVSGAATVRADAAFNPAPNPSGRLGAGNAVAGNANVSATDTGQLAFNNGLTFTANGTGGEVIVGGVAGSGTGGTATLTATGNGVITATDVVGQSNGAGGAVAGFSSGAGTGNTVSVGQEDAGAITISGNLDLQANGTGANFNGFATGAYSAGAGQGGAASVYGLGTGTVEVGGQTSVAAIAQGGNGESNAGVTNGGNASGGGANIGAGGTSLIRLLGGVTVDAHAQAGMSSNDAGGGATGIATGGLAVLGASSAGARVVINAPDALISLRADATGGDAGGRVVSSMATAGAAGISATGGSVTISAVDRVVIDSRGMGSLTAQGDGGRGMGGVATLFADNGGTITIGGVPSGDLVQMYASGLGGASNGNGAGGEGVSGRGEIQALAGSTVQVTGDTRIESFAVGGIGGLVGGAARGNTDISGTRLDSVLVNAAGGRIRLNGAVSAQAYSQGGTSLLDSGAGGDAVGGIVTIKTDVASPLGTSITMGALTVNADGIGAIGSGSLSQSGGDAGSGTGGIVTLLGAAGGTSGAAQNGLLTTGNAILSMNGIGGDGGNGTVGGQGGNGIGGAFRIGAVALAGPSNTGGAVFGNLTVAANGFGGRGGETDSGFGNSGGSATSGSIRSTFISDGTSVSAAFVQIENSAISGTGGGTAANLAGDATGNGFDFTVTQRLAGGPRGSMTLGAFGYTANVSLANASTGGVLRYGDGSVVTIDGGDVTAASFGIGEGVFTGTPLTTGAPTRFFMGTGTFTSSGSFILASSNQMSVYADLSTLQANDILLQTTGGFIVDPLLGDPTTPGLLRATNTLNVVSLADIVLGANVRAGSSVTLTAPNVNSISVLDVQSDGDITIATGGAATLRDLVAVGTIDVQTGDLLTIRDASANETISLGSGSTLTARRLDAGDSVRIRATDDITLTGPVSAGTVNSSSSSAALNDVGIYTGGSIQAGDISAIGRVMMTAGAGLSGVNEDITIGQISADSDVVLLAGRDMTLTGINFANFNVNAGRVAYLGSSQSLSSIPPIDFDPTFTLSQPPAPLNSLTITNGIFSGSVRANASIASLGDVTALDFISVTAGELTAGNIGAAGDFTVVANEDVTLGDLLVEGQIDIRSLPSSVSPTNITIGAVGGAKGFFAASTGEVRTGGMDISDFVMIDADTIVINGSIRAGRTNPLNDPNAGYFVSLKARSDLLAQSISALGGIDLGVENGALSTGELVSGTDVLILNSGQVSVGPVTAPGRILFADYAMNSLLTVNDLIPTSNIGVNYFNLDTIFNAPAIRLTGDVTVAGTINGGGSIVLTSNGRFSSGNIFAADTVSIDVNSLNIGNASVSGDFIVNSDETIITGGLSVGGSGGQGGQIDLRNNVGNPFGLFDITIGNVQSTKGVYIGGTGTVRAASINAGDFVYIQSDSIVVNGAISAGVNNPYTGPLAIPLAYLYANSSIDVQNVTSRSGILLAVSDGTLSAGALDATADVAILNNGAVTIGSATTGNRILFADYSLNDLLDPSDLSPTANPNVQFYRLDKVFNAVPTALRGDIVVTGALNAGGNIIFANTGGFQSGDMSAQGLIDGSSVSMALGNVSSQGNLRLFATTSITGGNVAAANNLSVVTPGTVDLGAVSSTASWVRLGFGQTSQGAAISAQSVMAGDISAAQGVGIAGRNSIVTGAIDAGDAVVLTNLPGNGGNGTITVNGAIRAGIVNPYQGSNANRSVAIAGSSGIVLGNVSADREIQISGRDGTIETGALVAGTNVALLGNGNIRTGAITTPGSGIVYAANNSMRSLLAPPSPGSSGSPGSLVTTAGFIISDFSPIYAAAPVALPNNFTAAGPISAGTVRIAALGTITLDDVTSSGLLSTSSANFIGGDLSANSLDLTVTGALDLQRVTIANDLALTAGTTLALANAVAGGDIDLTSTGAMTVGTLRAGDTITLDSGAGVTAGTLDAGASVGIRAVGDVAVTGPISAGINSPLSGARYDVGIGTLGSIATGSITAGRRVALVSGFANNGSGGVTAGQINAGSDIFVLSKRGVTLSGITSSDTGGAIYVGGSDVLATFPQSDLDLIRLLDGAPTPLGGNIVANGALNAGAVLLAAASRVSLLAVNANSIFDVTANGGLLTLAGNVRAPRMILLSGDIAIGQGVRLDAGDTGNITFISNNEAGMIIGDVAGGFGYTIDRAEFTRINSGSVTFLGADISNQDIDMTLGTVDITGPLAGSTIDDPIGTVNFVTGNIDSNGIFQTLGGIRITGAVRGFGFLPTNAVTFSTGVFQLDAENGLLDIQGANGTLAGTLQFNAQRIHVARAGILDSLLANPLYAGREVDINTPLTQARPNGVVRARIIELGEADQVLVQNTGTVELPAGFLTLSDTTLDRNTVPALGSVDLIINGQLLLGDGTVTGRDVVPLLIDNVNRPFFTSVSSINGCLVASTDCGPTQTDAQDPFLQGDNLLVIQTPNTGRTPEMTDDTSDETAEERKKREEAEREAERAPIPPPSPLISTQPLNPAIDVDEPVAGSGNPSLIGGGSLNLTPNSAISADAPLGKGVGQ